MSLREVRRQMWVSDEFYNFAQTKSHEFEKITGIKISVPKTTTIIARENKTGKRLMPWDIM